MEKILTIIVPTYNMEKYLDKCLTSLIVSDEQMKQLEVLVINDGSKDRSSEIAHGYEQRYPQTFHVIDKENGNYGSCINRGVKEATGKYVKVLDADDSFEKSNFTFFVKLLNDIDVDLIITDCTIVNDEYVTTSTKRLNGIPVSQKIEFSNYSKFRSANDLIMHMIAYRTDIIKSMGYKQLEGISYTDMQWLQIPMTKVETVYYAGFSLYKYLVGREGQTVTPESRKKNFKSTSMVLQVLMKYFDSNAMDDIHRKYFFKTLCNNLRFVYDNGILRQMFDEEEFMKFDKMIEKQHKVFYDWLNNIDYAYGSHYYYVARWRESKTSGIPFLIKLYKVILDKIVSCGKMLSKIYA